MKQDIEACLDRTFHVLENVCPTGNVIKGITSRYYHRPDSETPFSLFSASQILWALASSKKFPKTHYLVVELLAQINELLNNDIINKYDRILSKAFWFLALTCAGQPVQSEPYKKILENIIASQNERGIWGTCSESEGDLRATAVVVVSFCECIDRYGESSVEPYAELKSEIHSAVTYMIGEQKKEGFFLRRIKSINPEQSVTYQPGIELTAWIIYAMLKSMLVVNFNNEEVRKIKRTVKSAINWLIRQEIQDIATKSEIEEEYYIKNGRGWTHDYGAGSLEIMILALTEYRYSDFYSYIKNLDSFIEKAIMKLLEDEKDGTWHDKNSNSYTKLWKMAYVVKCLSAYFECISDEILFKKKVLRKIFLTGCTVLSKIRSIIFSIPLIVIYFIIGFVFLCSNYRGDSPIIGYVSLALGVIGIVVSIYYGKKGNT